MAVQCGLSVRRALVQSIRCAWSIAQPGWACRWLEIGPLPTVRGRRALRMRFHGSVAMVAARVTRRTSAAPGVVDHGWGCFATSLAPSWERRIGYSHVMNWFDPTKAHAVPRSVALRDEVYAPRGVTGESIRVVGG